MSVGGDVGDPSTTPWVARLGKNGEVIWSKALRSDMEFVEKALRGKTRYSGLNLEILPDGGVILEGRVDIVLTVSGCSEEYSASWRLRVGLEDGNLSKQECFGGTAGGCGGGSP